MTTPESLANQASVERKAIDVFVLRRVIPSPGVDDTRYREEAGFAEATLSHRRQPARDNLQAAEAPLPSTLAETHRTVY